MLADVALEDRAGLLKFTEAGGMEPHHRAPVELPELFAPMVPASQHQTCVAVAEECRHMYAEAVEPDTYSVKESHLFVMTLSRY